MNTRTPSLRQLADGRWFTKWGGRRHFLGRDPVQAAERYGESLKAWQAWRLRVERARASVPHAQRRPLVIDVAEEFLAAKKRERGPRCAAYYRSSLRRFLHAHRHEYAQDIRVAHLAALRHDLLDAGYAPKTVNHDTTAIKTLLTWAYTFMDVPAQPLMAFRNLPLPEPPDKSLSREEVRAFLLAAAMPIRAWLAVNYLTAARPTEVPRLVHQEGTWLYPGVFRLGQSKTSLAGSPRHLIVSPLALCWLKRCEPRWQTQKAYYHAVVRACGPGGPHRLRHSAMTHLLQAGVRRAEADQILGHLPGRVSRTYGRIEWRALVEKAAQLNFRRDRRAR